MGTLALATLTLQDKKCASTTAITFMHVRKKLRTVLSLAEIEEAMSLELFSQMARARDAYFLAM